MTHAVAGQVGAAATADFMGFLKLFEVAPDIDKLIADPEKADVPEDPAIMFAVSSAIASRMDKKNASNCLKYLTRLPQKEFIAFAVKDALSRDKSVASVDAVRKWITSEGAMLALS